MRAVAEQSIAVFERTQYGFLVFNTHQRRAFCRGDNGERQVLERRPV
jgi:hypothetical protein